MAHQQCNSRLHHAATQPPTCTARCGRATDTCGGRTAAFGRTPAPGHGRACTRVVVTNHAASARAPAAQLQQVTPALYLLAAHPPSKPTPPLVARSPWRQQTQGRGGRGLTSSHGGQSPSQQRRLQGWRPHARSSLQRLSHVYSPWLHSISLRFLPHLRRRRSQRGLKVWPRCDHHAVNHTGHTLAAHVPWASAAQLLDRKATGVMS